MCSNSGYESLFREWGTMWGMLVENHHIPFIFIARESLGGNQAKGLPCLSHARFNILPSRPSQGLRLERLECRHR